MEYLLEQGINAAEEYQTFESDVQEGQATLSGQKSCIAERINAVISICLRCSFYFFASWCLSVIICIRAISAIDNPSNHIIKRKDFSGIFYGGFLYKPKFIDAMRQAMMFYLIMSYFPMTLMILRKN